MNQPLPALHYEVICFRYRIYFIGGRPQREDTAGTISTYLLCKAKFRVSFPTAKSPFVAWLETQPFLCMTSPLLPFCFSLILEWLIVLYKILHKELFYFPISMKAWVPTHKTSTKPSISQQNEKPLLPSAFLKCEGFLSGTGNVYSPATENTVVKTNQTHIHVSSDRCLLLSLEAYEGFTFFSFFFFFLE